MKRRTFLMASGAMALLSPMGARAQTSGHLSIVTSLPKELSGAYAAAFKALYPGVTLDVQQRGTQQSVTFLRETANNNVADIFWASAPDAFETLKGEGLLAAFEPQAQGVATSIGDYPINDPEHYYAGFALSGAAIMWNTRYADMNGLPPAKEWDDLTRPEFFDHVGMAMPSRSGSTHLTVETILQSRGWEAGWKLLRAMCGNMRMITERSFGVPDGIASGQFGYGIVLDYQALAAQGAGFPIAFAYPGDTTIVPSNIGIVANSPNRALAEAFIEFMLSPEGQMILFEPTVGRLPVRPDSYAEAPEGVVNPFDISWGENGGFKFDVHLSESRYPMVDTLFDQTITFQLDKLRSVTRALHEAGAKLADVGNAEAMTLLDEARDLIGRMPFDGDQPISEDLNQAFEGASEDTKGARQAEVEQAWASFAAQNYAQAEARIAAALKAAG